MQFSIFQDSHQGSRLTNQDRVAYSYSRESLLMIVADGMGGHSGGEIAAEMVIRMLVECFQQQATPKIRDPGAFLEQSFKKLHRALGEYAARFAILETPKTTAVACIVQEDTVTYAYCGDSRGYLIRGNQVQWRSKDHSKVAQLIEQGLLSERAALQHPERNKIYSCLGGLVDPIISVSKRMSIYEGDTILLCSDGLWGVFEQHEIIGWLSRAPVMHALPSLLIEAEHRGGRDGDNVTAIAMRWGPQIIQNSTLGITETMTLSLGQFSTQMDREISLSNTKTAGRDLTEEEIERAIAEIQATINKYTKQT